MQIKPKLQQRVELYLIVEEATTRYLHDIEQSLNSHNIHKPAKIQFTDEVELALKFPSKNVAFNVQNWMQEKAGFTTKVVLSSTSKIN